jgi:transketolase
LENALLASQKLAEKGVGTIVVNPSIINQPDLDTITACLEKTGGRLLTLEDHRVVGGMGALLTHALAQKDVALRVRSMGIQDHFGRSAYTSDQLYEKYGLGVGAIVEATQSLL